MNSDSPRKALLRTILKGASPGLTISIIDLSIWFVCGLNSVWMFEILGLLTIFELFGLMGWIALLVIRRQFKASIAALCMLIASFGLGQHNIGAYLYGARMYIHMHIDVETVHSWAREELKETLKKHPDWGTVTVWRNDRESAKIIEMFQQPDKIFVTRMEDGTGELYVAWRGLGLWFSSGDQEPETDGKLEIKEGVYLGINPMRQ